MTGAEAAALQSAQMVKEQGLMCDGSRRVLLVDPVPRRRATAAAALRATGRCVRAVATPLCAIHQLGESDDRLTMVAIADTEPAGIADDLRDYVRGAHPELVLVRMTVAQ
jgi:hypothetical protein